MLALKPSLFPLPPLCCLLFLQSTLHSGFNSLQTLPNGFFTWGPQHAQASHQFPEISRTPQTQEGDPFPTLSPLSPGCSSALFCVPDTKLGGQRGKSSFVGLTAVDAWGATPAERRTCPESLINLAAGRGGTVAGGCRRARLCPAAAGRGGPRQGLALGQGWRRPKAKGASCGGAGLGRRVARCSLLATWPCEGDLVARDTPPASRLSPGLPLGCSPAATERGSGSAHPGSGQRRSVPPSSGGVRRVPSPAPEQPVPLPAGSLTPRLCPSPPPGA